MTLLHLSFFLSFSLPLTFKLILQNGTDYMRLTAVKTASSAARSPRLLPGVGGWCLGCVLLAIWYTFVCVPWPRYFWQDSSQLLTQDSSRITHAKLVSTMISFVNVNTAGSPEWQTNRTQTRTLQQEFVPQAGSMLPIIVQVIPQKTSLEKSPRHQ